MPDKTPAGWHIIGPIIVGLAGIGGRAVVNPLLGLVLVGAAAFWAAAIWVPLIPGIPAERRDNAVKVSWAALALILVVWAGGGFLPSTGEVPSVVNTNTNTNVFNPKVELYGDGTDARALRNQIAAMGDRHVTEAMKEAFASLVSQTSGKRTVDVDADGDVGEQIRFGREIAVALRGLGWNAEPQSDQVVTRYTGAGIGVYVCGRPGDEAAAGLARALELAGPVSRCGGDHNFPEGFIKVIIEEKPPPPTLTSR